MHSLKNYETVGFGFLCFLLYLCYNIRRLLFNTVAEENNISDQVIMLCSGGCESNTSVSDF